MNAATLPLTGLTVLVTGEIADLSRDQARTAIEALGGTSAPGVTKKVDLIVLGDGAGISKTSKARGLNIAVLDPALFAALAADPTRWDGTTLGVSFDAWDSANPGQAPEPPPVIDSTHWVAKAVVHIPDADGEVQRQVRFICACGHNWMRQPLQGRDSCPRPAVPVTVAPWWPASDEHGLDAARPCAEPQMLSRDRLRPFQP